MSNRNNIKLTPLKLRPLSCVSSENTASTLEVFNDVTVTKPVKRLPDLMPLKQLSLPKDKVRVNGTIYTKGEELGIGGFSTVHAIEANGKSYALKLVNLEGHSRAILQGLKREMELLQLLKGCWRVVQLHEYELSETHLAMVMEQGSMDMHEIIHCGGEHFQDIPFLVGEMLDCIEQVHQRGIVHSDLKPSNFIMCRGALKLVDFGISSAIPEHTAHIYKTQAIGTIAYMAPETLLESTRIVGELKFGKPSDLWSFGCIIYEMFYSRPPFKSYGKQEYQAITDKWQPDWSPQGTYGIVPDHYTQLIKGLLEWSPAARLTVDGVRQHLKNTPPISLAFVQDLVTFTLDLGGKDAQKRTDKRLEEIAEAVFHKLKCLAS